MDLKSEAEVDQNILTLKNSEVIESEFQTHVSEYDNIFEIWFDSLTTEEQENLKYEESKNQGRIKDGNSKRKLGSPRSSRPKNVKKNPSGQTQLFILKNSKHKYDDLQTVPQNDLLQ